MQHTLEAGPLSRGEMVHHCGLQKERVSECVMYHWCNTLWERAHYQEGRDVASTWSTRTNERVSVASVMQHTKGAGPVLRGERWCITVACRRKGLASVCCISDSDAAHLGSERGEMLHQRGLQGQMSECVLHQWCNTLREQAHYREGRDVCCNTSTTGWTLNVQSQDA